MATGVIFRALFCCLALAFLGQAASSLAQPAEEISAIGGTLSPGALDRSTPLRAALGFMQAAERGDYELAATYLDLRNLPDDVAAENENELSRQLYIVVSRRMQTDFYALSDEPQGLTDDGLPSYRDALGKIRTPQGELTVYLQQVPDNGDSRIWKISNASVARIPQLYRDYGYGPTVEGIRRFSPEGSLLGAEYFKWIAALLSAVLGTLAWLVIVRPLSALMISPTAPGRVLMHRYLTRPCAAVVFVVVAFTVIRDLGLGLTAQRYAQSHTILTLVAIWLTFETIDLFKDLYAQYLTERGRLGGLMLLRPLTSIVKFTVAAVALVVWLDNVGVNVTALVAGLGVGGLAVALVMQRPLEDLLGAITLFTQQPIRIGQFCTCENVTGTVEEISLRATKIRTIQNTLVVIPNARFATASLENISERSSILYEQTVRLAPGTPESKLRHVLEKLRDLLQSHPMVISGTSRARLVELGEFSINVQMFAPISTTDWPKYLEIAEELNLGIIGALESVGVSLVEPRI